MQFLVVGLAAGPRGPVGTEKCRTFDGGSAGNFEDTPFPPSEHAPGKCPKMTGGFESPALLLPEKKTCMGGVGHEGGTGVPFRLWTEGRGAPQCRSGFCGASHIAPWAPPSGATQHPHWCVVSAPPPAGLGIGDWLRPQPTAWLGAVFPSRKQGSPGPHSTPAPGRTCRCSYRRWRCCCNSWRRPGAPPPAPCAGCRAPSQQSWF